MDLAVTKAYYILLLHAFCSKVNLIERTIASCMPVWGVSSLVFARSAHACVTMVECFVCMCLQLPCAFMIELVALILEVQKTKHLTHTYGRARQTGVTDFERCVCERANSITALQVKARKGHAIRASRAEGLAHVRTSLPRARHGGTR